MKTGVLTFASTITFAALAAAQDVDNNDVPSVCRQICAPVVSLTQRCDNNNDDDDAQLQCVCSASNASTFVPECEACVAANSNDGDDNDVNDIRTSCSFTSATYTATQTTTSSMSPTDNPANGIIIPGQNTATMLSGITIGSVMPTQTSMTTTSTMMMTTMSTRTTTATSSTAMPTQGDSDNSNNDNDGSDADTSNNSGASPTDTMAQQTGAASAVMPKSGLAAAVMFGAAALLRA